MSSIILTTGTPSTGGSPMPAETPASKPTSAESQSVLKPRKRMTRMGLLAIAVSVACGTFGGVGAFTFGYGEGAAYLSNNPASCANCHVMQRITTHG